MDNHDAIKKMVQAYKTLNIAITNSTQGQVIHLIGIARDMVYDVADNKFGKEFLEELRRSEIN